MMSGVLNATVQLYLLRHAHAGDPAKWTGPDERRPLSAKGRLQAERLAHHLAALHVDLDAIVSSPKVRARETAEPVARALHLPVRIDDRLGGGLTVRGLDEVIADAGDAGSVMVVGHDPDFSELAADLLGAPSLPMRKGALARFDGPRPLHPGGLILRWVLPPDAIPGGSED
jgi:phosphohistidine phosphatase SixA